MIDELAIHNNKQRVVVGEEEHIRSVYVSKHVDVSVRDDS